MRKLAATLCLLGLSGAVGAQSWPDVHFTARPTLGETTRFNRPFPVTVDLEYTGSETVVGRVLAQDLASARTTAEVNVTLAPGPPRQVPLLYPDASYMLETRVESGRRSTAAQQTTLTGTSDQDIILLVLGPTGAEFNYLGGYKSPSPESGDLRLNHPRPDTPLPEVWSAYLGVDLAIVYDLPHLSLSEAAQNALLDWTRAGGTLVLASNLDPGEYRHSPLAEFAPLRLSGTERLGDIPVMRGTNQGGTSVYSEKGHSLLWHRPLGCGQVFQLTADVRDQDALGSKPTEKLWREVFSRYRASTFRAQRFNAAEVMNRPEELPVPSAAAIAWYLVAYVFVAVPINYLVLRKKDRLLWMVASIPAIALVFSGGAFLVNSRGRSTRVVLRQLGCAFLPSGSDQAVADQHLMLFSPSSSKFQLKFPQSTYLRPTGSDGHPFGSELRFCMDASHMFYKDFHLPMWSIARFRSTSLHKLAGPLSWVRENDRLKVQNHSGLRLQHCRLVDHLQCSQPFALEPGSQTIQLKLGSDEIGTLLAADLPPKAVQKEDVHTLLNEVQAVCGNRACLLGWCDEPGVEVGLEVGQKVDAHRRTLLASQEGESR